MAYFSNGTESADYEFKYCEQCVHFNDDSGGCPVMLLHLLHNYRECNKSDSFLDVLIPRSKDGLDNEQCKMFHPEGGRDE